jgi:hypothetical protein
LIKAEVRNYNESVLNQFDGVFRYSNFLRRIDTIDPGILNSFARLYLQKTFIPSLIGNQVEEINFSGSLYVPSERDSIINSSRFAIGGYSAFLRDEPIINSGLRDVYIYTNRNGNFVKGLTPIGTLNSRTGVLTLENFFPDNASSIKIDALPNSYNIAPRRNQLIDIDISQLTIDGEIDTIATSGSNSENYNTIPRFK